MKGSAISSAAQPSRQEAAAFDPRPFIQARLPLAPVPTVPEISLHMAQPASGLWRLAERDRQGFGSPYWAYPWAGGIALARYILDHPEAVTGRSVLDVGAGAGLVGIAAAKAGAHTVLAADVDRYAIAALSLNAAANAVTLAAVLKDVIAGPPPPVDLVVIGDLFYEARLAVRVTSFLDWCAAAGVTALIGDPGRAFLPVARLRRLADYPVPDMGESRTAAVKTSAVFAFEPA